MSRTPRNPSSPALRPALWPAVLVGAAWALLACAPAAWVADAVASSTRGHVLLADARGTWHAGSALLVLQGAEHDAELAPGRLRWTLGFADVWRGRVHLTLDWPDVAPAPLRLETGLAAGGWTLRQTDAETWAATLPASLLVGLGAPWNTIAPDGALALTMHGLGLRSAQGRLRMHGALQLDARDMRSRLSPVAPLGSWRLRLEGEGADAALRLSTLEGPLMVEGTGDWNGSRLQFTGRAHAAPGQEQALAGLLDLIGQPDGSGVRIAL